MSHIAGQFEKLRARLIQQGHKFYEQTIRPRSKKTRSDFEEITNLDMKFWLSLEAVRRPEEKSHFTDEQRERVHERMTRLNKQQMQVIRLIFFEGFHRDDVARTMKISRRRVQYILKQALDVLRE